jgi:hypothetical protein
MTMMLATMKIPLAPAPEITRPTMNILNEPEVAMMRVPAEMSRVEKNMQSRGLKTWDKRPMRGARDDMAMRYDEVSQLTLSNASRSEAIADCVVVRIDMFVAVIGQSWTLQYERLTAVRRHPSTELIRILSWVYLGVKRYCRVEHLYLAERSKAR